MSAAHWVAVGWMAAEALATILRVGKPRKPLSPSDATIMVVSWAALAALVVLG